MAATRPRETIIKCLDEAQSGSKEGQKNALKMLVTNTKVSPQNRNFLAQTDGSIPTLFSLCKSSDAEIQNFALSILFNLSLNPNLKQSLADMDNIVLLNSLILLPVSPETSKLTASLLCSLAMLDKNKARFGVAGTIQALVKAISARPTNQATHHILSTLAELVQFHGNCTVAVHSGSVPVLLNLVDNADLSGTSLAILALLARFNEGLNALKKTEHIVKRMMEVLKGRCMLSKEGAAEVLIRLFDESEGCLRDAVRLPEFSTVLADMSVRGSVKAREKSGLLMKKMAEANLDSALDGGKLYLEW